MSGEPSSDAPAPPVPPADTPPGTPARRHVLSGPQRLLNTAIAVVLLAELVALLGHPLFGWGDKFYAATPQPLTYHPPQPLSGDAVLLRLADESARQPADGPGSSGTYAYVKRQSWQLAGAGSGQRGHVLPTVIESWRSPDGTDRVMSWLLRSPGGPTAPRAESGSAAPAPRLSTAISTVARQLLAAAPRGSDDVDREFLGLAKLADDQPISPPVRTAILTALARVPDVTNSGTVTDRDGRTGVAVSVEPDSPAPLMRDTLIFDPSTGALLEADQTVIGDSQDPSIRDGSVIAYTTFDAAGFVRSPTALP